MILLVTGAWSASQEQLDAIGAMGHTVVRMQDERGPMPCDYDTVEGAICNGLFLYHPLERFHSLKYIQLTSAGLDRVPMDEIDRRGIQIHNARGVYSIPMAEMALCGVLQLYKHSRFFTRNQSRNLWEKHRGLKELAGKTVCVVGCGSVGTACAQRFAAFGCRVLGVNIRPRTCMHFERVVPLEQIDETLAQSDIVVLAVPLAPETRHLMNAQRFAAMKQEAILVNLSRGALVETHCLIEALESRLGGAVLDVFEQEPLAEDSPLWNMENVIITPHNSFVGEGNGARLYRLILDNLEKVK